MRLGFFLFALVTTLQPLLAPPGVVVQAAPTYPRAARMARVEGATRVLVEIGADGNVTSATVIGRTLPLGLERACLDAAKCWRFDRGAEPIRGAVLDFVFGIDPRTDIACRTEMPGGLPPYQIRITCPSPPLVSYPTAGGLAD